MRLKRQVKIDIGDGQPRPVEVSSALLKRNGRVMRRFEGNESGAPNAIDFGLFPFLGGEMKQLVVSYTEPRTGRHWIVALPSEPRVVFDSADYEVGREDVSLRDFDKDGVYEISLPVVSFYVFSYPDMGNLSMSNVPLPVVIFKYDVKASKYLPANHLFKTYLLQGIEDRHAKLSDKNDDTYLGDRLEVLLDYVYAGEEKAGWHFFDSEYKRHDKEQMKAKIKAVLKEGTAYRYINRQRAA